ncbi:phosphopantetheine-binding protein [Bartonella queenslandensis]|uniref:phosphopantetheine-binding protein n=1 Tax=Bartonella queenslandensis TaxID=481138 RepID=UPI001BA47CCF|nr:phosphopantetheine-binding protein [Bartonella queenslandensis]
MTHDEVELSPLVAEIKNLLKENDVRLSDNFIELGGNSLLAMAIVEKLQRCNGIKIDLAQLLSKQIGEVKLSFFKQLDAE